MNQNDHSPYPHLSSPPCSPLSLSQSAEAPPPSLSALPDNWYLPLDAFLRPTARTPAVDPKHAEDMDHEEDMHYDDDGMEYDEDVVEDDDMEYTAMEYARCVMEDGVDYDEEDMGGKEEMRSEEAAACATDGKERKDVESGSKAESH